MSLDRGWLAPGIVLTLVGLALPAAAQTTPGTDQLPGRHFDIRAESLPLPGPPMPYVANAPVRVPLGDHVPIVPDGFTATLFASRLPGPRRLEVLPDGRVLVVLQSAGQLVGLRDTEGDGVADGGALLVEGLRQPFGIALIPGGPYAGDLFVSDSTTVWRFPLKAGGDAVAVTPPGAFSVAMGHITRALAVDPATGDFFVGVGSTQNLAIEAEPKATVQRFAADGAGQSTFARGLRNATGLRIQPGTGDLYAVVMERDAMGDALVPDYFTRIEQGDDFGWPYQYAGGFVQPEYADGSHKRAAAKLPDVMFEAHSAPMDLVFVPDSWPEEYRGDAIVALRGSSNRTVPTGYKLVRIPFGDDGRPSGGYDNFATGFWVGGDATAEVWGRPAALALLPDGGLLVADDFGGTLWKIMPPGSPPVAAE